MLPAPRVYTQNHWLRERPRKKAGSRPTGPETETQICTTSIHTRPEPGRERERETGPERRRQANPETCYESVTEEARSPVGGAGTPITHPGRSPLKARDSDTAQVPQARGRWTDQGRPASHQKQRKKPTEWTTERQVKIQREQPGASVRTDSSPRESVYSSTPFNLSFDCTMDQSNVVEMIPWIASSASFLLELSYHTLRKLKQPHGGPCGDEDTEAQRKQAMGRSWQMPEGLDPGVLAAVDQREIPRGTS
ncbi:uncharacterized protein LOC124110168 [Marmota monax]|uniref:uncharacterized protein LOC124110168 n=1 Tax=Marmota monax TaxID=9995 RepID=UPI0026EAC63E|nr:uncharacterized protein LOC124110168 [Marmota monax]